MHARAVACVPIANTTFATICCATAGKQYNAKNIVELHKISSIQLKPDAHSDKLCFVLFGFVLM